VDLRLTERACRKHKPLAKRFVHECVAIVQQCWSNNVRAGQLKTDDVDQLWVSLDRRSPGDTDCPSRIGEAYRPTSMKGTVAFQAREHMMLWIEHGRQQQAAMVTAVKQRQWRGSATAKTGQCHSNAGYRVGVRLNVVKCVNVALPIPCSLREKRHCVAGA
jgi:hypothetical protein